MRYASSAAFFRKWTALLLSLSLLIPATADAEAVRVGGTGSGSVLMQRLAQAYQHSHPGNRQQDKARRVAHHADGQPHPGSSESASLFCLPRSDKSVEEHKHRKWHRDGTVGDAAEVNMPHHDGDHTRR